MALALSLVTVSGCATNGFVRDEIAKANSYTDQKTAAVQGDVSQLRGDVDRVSGRTEQAYAKASLAERVAYGDVNYSVVSTHRAQFAFDDWRLSDEAQSILDNLATELSSHSGYVLEVRGYADATGSERYNYKLGRERADAVVRYLMTRHDVPANRLVTVSFGEDDPIADNGSRDGRADNRRVQVRLLAPEQPAEPMASTP